MHDTSQRERFEENANSSSQIQSVRLSFRRPWCCHSK